MSETIVYFAYGSNMYTPRLRFRVRGCKALGKATFAGHELRFHKTSTDGSAKCDAFRTGAASDQVVGILFEIPRSQKAALDDAEGLGHGYDEEIVTVAAEDGGSVEASTYIASKNAVDPSLQPYSWYHDFVRLGAQEHKLPPVYVQRFILNVAAKIDSNHARDQRKRAEVTP